MKFRWSIPFIIAGVWFVAGFQLPNSGLSVVSTAEAGLVSKYGYVFRRGLVTTDAGDPIFATFDDQGNVVREIGPATGDLQDAFVISALDYQLLRQRVADGVAAGHRLMTLAEYQGATFETIDAKPVSKPALKADTKSVLVLAADRILTVNDKIIVEEFPIQAVNAADLNPDTTSVLINRMRSQWVGPSQVVDR